MTTTATLGVTDRFLAAVEAGQLTSDLYASDALLDATVPGWRLQAQGADAVVEQYRGWFTGTCRLHLAERHPLPEGELIRYVLTDLEPECITTHHLHLLTIVDDKIARDVVFCGGRWGPELVAQMGAAALHVD